MLIALSVSAISGIVCADTVDDLCAEFGYTYRWTVEVDFDDTFDNTVLGTVAGDSGRLQISYIVFENKMPIIGKKPTSGCYVFLGKYEMFKPFGEEYTTMYVKGEDGYCLVTIGDEENLFHRCMKKVCLI